LSHPKRIVISGYYGFSNAGDEAVLSAVVRGLKSQTSAEITVLSASPEETAKTHGVRALPRMAMTEVTRALKDCDLLISGGGSLLQDATSLRSLAYYLAIISLAKRYRRKVMILGQGIGPLRRSISRRMVKKALTGIDLITVRDAQSAELLAEMGIGPVKITADPTFMLEPCKDAHGLLAEAGLAEEEDIIGVALREWDERPEVGAEAAKALKAIAEKCPAKMLLLTMQTPQDEAQARDIGREIGAVVQPRPWTAEELLGVISRCRLVVGMRLHALIFAASVGVPFLGIEYDPKVEQFIKAAGQEGIKLDEMASLGEKAREAWDTRDELALKLKEAVPAMKKAASENIRLAVELLADGQER
jgi:polysaccharide pyruvyl transferase CsaB